MRLGPTTKVDSEESGRSGGSQHSYPSRPRVDGVGGPGAVVAARTIPASPCRKDGGRNGGGGQCPPSPVLGCRLYPPIAQLSIGGISPHRHMSGGAGAGTLYLPSSRHGRGGAGTGAASSHPSHEPARPPPTSTTFICICPDAAGDCSTPPDRPLAASATRREPSTDRRPSTATGPLHHRGTRRRLAIASPSPSPSPSGAAAPLLPLAPGGGRHARAPSNPPGLGPASPPTPRVPLRVTVHSTG